MKEVIINLETSLLTIKNESGKEDIPFNSSEAFKIISDIWLRLGWDNKHVYTFTWMGRPIIQLPEDMIRIQELIYRIKPTLIIETGVAHGGSLIYYASLLQLLGKGRVIGIDIDIRSHNRRAIEQHSLSKYITLIEADSVAPEIVKQVGSFIKSDDIVLILLDSNHTYDHVLNELKAYSQFVTPGSYIIATDGIMEQVAGAPRTNLDWDKNNPRQAALDFVNENKDFYIEQPTFLFNESLTIKDPVTYWPDSWIKRKN